MTTTPETVNLQSNINRHVESGNGNAIQQGMVWLGVAKEPMEKPFFSCYLPQSVKIQQQNSLFFPG